MSRAVRAGRLRWCMVGGERQKICLGMFCNGYPQPSSEYGTRRNRGRTYLRPYCRRCERERQRLKDGEAKARWRRKNPEKIAIKRARREALLNKASGGKFNPSRPDYQQRLFELGWKCYWCQGIYECIDHLQPISRGGSNDPSNVVPSCLSCNSSRQARTPEAWVDRPYLRKQQKL